MDILISRRFNLNVWGKGEKIMMFAHGLGCDQKMWRFITPAFENDYTIVLFDFLGCGDSDITAFNQEKYPSLNEYADDILTIITTLKLSNLVLVGHSVGSMISLLAAIKQPALFKKVIMVSPSPCYLNYRDYHGGFEKFEIEELLEKLKLNLAQWAEKFAPVIMGDGNSSALVKELKDSFVSTNHNALYHFAELTFKADLRTELQKLKVPSLVMQCSEDVIAPVGVGEFMHNQISQSKLVVIKATGHCAHLSEPGETVALIKEYLEENT